VEGVVVAIVRARTAEKAARLEVVLYLSKAAMKRVVVERSPGKTTTSPL
jgi:hypothetical protein